MLLIFYCSILLLCITAENHEMCTIADTHKDGGDPANRIVGDSRQASHAPFQVSLLFYRWELGENKTWSTCGGTIISEHYVITAAHCVDYDRTNKVMFVAFGVLNICEIKDEMMRNPKGPWNNVMPIEEIIPHPDYYVDPQRMSTRNDIAIIKVKQNFNKKGSCPNGNRFVRRFEFGSSYATLTKIRQFLRESSPPKYW